MYICLGGWHEEISQGAAPPEAWGGAAEWVGLSGFPAPSQLMGFTVEWLAPWWSGGVTLV